jgi:hypothetical protein
MNPDIFVNRWAKIALHFLVFSAIAGLVLRYYNFSPITGLNYKNLLHTHSHVALLGWLYLALAVTLVKEFLPSESKKFNKILLFTLFTVIGMMLSFPFQGYAALSISFSTLFLFASYWFVYEFYRKLGTINDKSVAAGWARWALFFLAISSLGPWALGPIMVFGESHGTLYNLSIYYYLHFLYNGFFVSAVFAIMLKWLDNNGITYSNKSANRFFQFTVYPVIPAYTLSTLWVNPPNWVYIIAGFAAVMQVIGLFYGWSQFIVYLKNNTNKFFHFIFWLVIVAYSIKLIMQVFSAMPLIADYVYETRVFTAIGYLHLVMLGFLTLFLLTYFIKINVFTDSALVRAGLIIFLIGLISSEFVLFLNGLILTNTGSSITSYAQWVFIASLLIPIGLLLFWIIQLNRKLASKNLPL